jgi:predicted GNAT superfamily acetyltransferase
MTYAVGDIGRYPSVAARLLPLNNQSARETSLLDAAKFARMIAAARVATIVWPNAAFLLAFDQDAYYDSPNFLWFRGRFDSFVYVDRVIVSNAHRRAGLGRLLYVDLLRRAEYLPSRASPARSTSFHRIRHRTRSTPTTSSIIAATPGTSSPINPGA